MRVGIAVYGDLDQVSGGYLYDRKLIEHLEARGDEVIVFSQPKRAYPLRLTENFDPSFWRRLVSADLDVLLQDELNHASLVFGNRWLRRSIDAPIVTIVHHLRAKEPRSRYSKLASRFLERLYLQATDARIYNSQTTRQSVEHLAGTRPCVVARPSGRRFGPPASAEMISERATSGDPFRVLYVGNLIPRKRLHLLIEGLDRARCREWRLDVVGDLSANRSYATVVRRRIRRLSDPARISLHGQLPDEELRRRFSGSHVLAVPSAYEGYGIVYVEAMGHGLPVIASPNGGVCDVVEDGENGRFAETAAGIANAIDEWHFNRDCLADMGRAAIAHYRSSPTWAETGRRIASFLDRLPAVSSSQPVASS